MSKTNKHAYLIIAHHQFELLKMLCKLLDHPNHDIFIHINQNSDFDSHTLDNTVKHSKITFINRKKVTWGGYSQIDCELRLLKAATAANSDGYSFYHLLSGADMPLKSADEIYSFFEENKGKEFVQCVQGDAAWQETMKKRINHYCIFQEKAGRENNIWYKRQEKLRHWQYTLEIDRTRKLGKTILSGANWFSISHNLAKYVISKEKWIEKHFRHTICADEIFLQTLIGGTEFADKLFDRMPQTQGIKACARFVDWQRGNPYTFTEQDFDLLVNSGCMFARKFDIENHPEICHKIFSHLTGL